MSDRADSHLEHTESVILGRASDPRRNLGLPSFWCLGFSFWWTVWLSDGIQNSSAWFPAPAQPPWLVLSARLTMYVPFALACLVLLICSSRLSTLFERPRLLMALAVVAGIGVALLCFGWTGLVADSRVLLLGSLLMGAAGAPTIVAWGELFGAIGARDAVIGICGSLVAAAVLHLVGAGIGPVAPLAVTALLACCPALSVVCLRMAWKDRRVRPLTRIVQQQAFRMPVAVTLWILSFGVVFGVLLGLTSSYSSLGTGGAAIAHATAIGAVAVFILVRMVRSGGLDFRRIYKPVAPLLALGFILLPILGHDQPALPGAAVYAGYAYVNVLFTLVYSDIIHRLPAPALRVTSWVYLADHGGIATGIAVYAIFFRDITLSSEALYTLSLAAVALLLLVSVYYLSEVKSISLWGLADTGSGAQPTSNIEQRCAALGNRFGLTPREQEILVFLGQGRNREYIQNRLVLSKFTVKTHMRRIYEKLGIHSQQELIDLVQREPD